MLSAIRNNKLFLKIVLWFIIAMFILTTFVVWGVQNFYTKKTFLAKVNGQEVSLQDFSRASSNYLEQMRKQFGASVTLNKTIKEAILNELINQSLVVQYGEKIGVPISEIEIANTIASQAQFTDPTTGRFNQTRYIQALQFSGISTADFEDSIRRDILVKKVQALVTNSIDASDEEVKNFVAYQTAKYNISYVKFPYTLYQDEIKPTADELKAFYKDNIQNYTTEKLTSIFYARLNETAYKSSLQFNITDKAISDYYAQHFSEFSKGASFTLDALKAKSPTFNNSEFIEYSKQNGFANATKKYAGEVSVVQTMTLGEQSLSAIYPNTASLKDGDVFETNMQSVKIMFHVASSTKASKKSFDDAKAEIIEKIKATQVNSSVSNLLSRVYLDFVNKSITQDDIVNKYKDTVGLNFAQSNKMHVDEILNITGLNLTLAYKMFNSTVGDVFPDAKIKDGRFIFKTVDTEPAHPIAYEEVASNVTRDYARSKGSMMAYIELMNATNSGLTLDKIVALHNGVSVMSTELKLDELNTRFDNSSMASIMTTTPVGKLLPPVRDFDGNYNAIVINKVTLPKDIVSNFTDYKAQNYNSVLSMKGELAFEIFVQSLRDKGEVIINEDML